MFNTYRKVLVIVGIVFCLISSVFAYSGGAGTAEDPYQIADANDLLELAADTNNYDKCFILTADIDLDPNLPGGQVFTTAIIGAANFTGTFDGNGHKITNFTINGNWYLGLFGKISSGGSVKNLGLENFDVNGLSDSRYVGGLVGENYGSISNCYSMGGVSGFEWVGGLAGYNRGGISNCYSTGSVSGTSRVGGMVGYNHYGSISDCYSTGAVSGTDYVGGLVGANFSGSISDCYSTGSVSGSNLVGGLVGWNYGSGGISNCYSTGAVSGSSGSEHVGGLVGWNEGGISNCYSTGAVSGYSKVGGLVGRNESGGSINNCYSTGAVSGSSNVGGLLGYNNGGSISHCYFLDTSGPNNGRGTPLTDAQMKQQSSFVGWDFLTIWNIVEGQTYPFFKRATYSGGTGTPDDPYRIAKTEDLLELAADTSNYDKCFILTADIDLQGQAFTTAIIASGDVFTGTFDGNGHKITNFTINGGSNSYLGLFGHISSGGSVKNLGLDNFSVSGSYYVGGLVGENHGVISNCYSTGAVSSGSYSNSLGGLVGDNYGNITNCYSTGAVYGGYNSGCLGGLVGYNYSGSIIACYSTGSVSGTGNYVGGQVGLNYGSISDCYATGAVSGGSYVGGLVGSNGGSVVSSFWDTQTSGQTTSAGGTGKTTAEMKTLLTFTSAGWDFVDTWNIGENQTYPFLRGYSGADLNYDGIVNFADFVLFANRWLQVN